MVFDRKNQGRKKTHSMCGVNNGVDTLSDTIDEREKGLIGGRGTRRDD